MDKNHVIAVVPAAGIGSRMQASVPKQYMRLFAGGPCIIEATVRLLLNSGLFDAVFVAVSKDDGWIQQMDLAKAQILRTGGQSRAHTVLQTLEAIAPQYGKNDLVLVHDAARPLVCIEDIKSLVTKAKAVRESSQASGAVLAMPVSDTVKRVSPDDIVTEEVSRDGLYRIATPQAFGIGDLLLALRDNTSVTDESSAMIQAGHKVAVVNCQPTNIKITRPADLGFATKLIQDQQHSAMDLRVGLGYDSHRLVAGRKLILGGVEIEHTLGLDGHSDADVLLHAITDALLGAAGCGNIGILFPDNDPAFKDADSAKLLQAAWSKVQQDGWVLINMDCVLVAEKPKINPHLPAIVANIASLLGVDPSRISVKPKTNEKLGFEGQQLGMSARAVALLQR